MTAAAHTLDAIEALAAEASAASASLDPSIPRDAIGFLTKYLPFQLSPAWRAFFGAFYGLALDDADREVLATICGFTVPRSDGYAEGEAITGRRGGKSANMAAIGVYEAVVLGAEHMRALAPGQRGYVLIVSRTQRQACEVYRYARATVERNPELAALLETPPLESQTGGELRFTNGVTLSVFPASKGSVRGFTILCAIADEWAWLGTDEQSANQDTEILSAIKYGMIAPKGAPRRRLMVISSPGAKAGVVFETWARHYGDPKAPVLVAHGPTWTWNPTVDRAALDEERVRDPKAFTREVLAEFVDAVSAWIDASAVTAAATFADAPRKATPLLAGDFRYSAAVDLAFKRDNSVLAIGHYELPKSVREREAVRLGRLDGWRPTRSRSDEWMWEAEERAEADRRAKKSPHVFVVDGVWAWKPERDAPLDAAKVVREMASCCQEYGVTQVTADQFAIVPLQEMFKRHGITLMEMTATSFSKFSAFSSLREAIYTKEISLPLDEDLLRELRELQERISGSSVQIAAPHRESAHDDRACAVAWLLASAKQPPRSTMRRTPAPNFWNR